MISSEEGSTTDFNPENAKQNLLIFFNWLPNSNSTHSRFRQSIKASFPIDWTDFGIVIDFNPVEWAKAQFSIVINELSENETDSRFGPQNAELWMTKQWGEIV